MEEQQRAWADLRRRLERVERAEQDGERPKEKAQESAGSEGRPPLEPFRQPAIPPEMDREMQEGAWRQIRGGSVRLAERDRGVVARERRVREDEGAVARQGHRVLPDPEGDTPSTDVERRLPSGKRARGEGGESGQARGKRCRVEEWGAGEAAGAPRPTSPSPEPTPTDWVSESPLPRSYAPQPVPTDPGTVWGWRAGETAELVRYLEWAGRTRGGRVRRGTGPFLRPASQGGEATGKGA